MDEFTNQEWGRWESDLLKVRSFADKMTDGKRHKVDRQRQWLSNSDSGSIVACQSPTTKNDKEGEI